MNLNNTKWLAYNDLAWIDQVISGNDENDEETEFLVKALLEYTSFEIKTILHFGCGAGFSDNTFKKRFKVTGVDISPGMLDIARKKHPEINYHYGDMRNIVLNECFDAVVIPDSIDYIRTEVDLFDVMKTAERHLKPGGTLLINAHPAESFKPNNFVYTGSNKDVEVTLFENNYIPPLPGTGYEATLVYLIRRHGKLEIFTDIHQLGLFKLQTWLDLFKNSGFENVIQTNMDDSYDRFIMGEEKYSQLVFICSKHK